MIVFAHVFSAFFFCLINSYSLRTDNHLFYSARLVVAFIIDSSYIYHNNIKTVTEIVKNHTQRRVVVNKISLIRILIYLNSAAQQRLNKSNRAG